MAAEEASAGLDEPFLSKPGVAQDVLPAADPSPGNGYNYGSRPWQDIAFLVVFLVVCVASIGFGIFSIVNSNPDFFDPGASCTGDRDSGLISLSGMVDSTKNVPFTWILNNIGLGNESAELFQVTLIASTVTTLIVSVPLLWGLLWLLRTQTNVLVYASLPLFLLAPFVLNITWFVYCLNDNRCQESLDLSFRITIFFLIFLFCALFVWVIYAARDRIELSIKIIRTAAESLNKNLELMLVLPTLFLCFAAYFVALFFFVFYSRANGKLVVNSYEDPRISSPCVWRSEGWVPAYLTLALLALYWSIAVLHELQSFVISGTVSQWYFAPADSSIKGATKRSLSHAFGPSLGTICFAGLILAVVRMVRGAANNTRRNRGQEGLLAIIFRCCLDCILRTVEFLTNFTIIFTAITGEDFCSSAYRTYELLKRTLLSTVFVESIAGNLLSSVVLVAATIYTVLVFGFVYLLTDLQSGPSLVVALVSWVLLGLILGLSAQVLSKTVDTVYICYAIDKDTGYVSKLDIHEIYVLLPSTAADPPSLAVAQP